MAPRCYAWDNLRMIGGVTEVPGDAPARIEGQEFESPRAPSRLMRSPFESACWMRARLHARHLFDLLCSLPVVRAHDYGTAPSPPPGNRWFPRVSALLESLTGRSG